jgi:hypothetical protein
MQALEEAKRRAALEQRNAARLTELDKQRLELRSHVLSLREGELDSRLRDRDRTIEELNARLRELTGVLRKEQATRELLTRQLTTPVPHLLARSRRPKRPARKSKPPAASRNPVVRRAGPLKRSRKSNLRRTVRRKR